MTSPRIFDRARDFAGHEAVTDATGRYRYRHLLDASARVAGALLAGRDTLAGERVAFLVTPSFRWVATAWGIHRAGGVAVPLALPHPPPEHAHTLDDAEVASTVADPELADRLRPLAAERSLPLATPAELLAHPPAPALSDLRLEDPALLLYTSGTTGRPKGVVITHGNLEAQVRTLASAWGWWRDDRIADFLPLHHVHGIVNVLGCALWSGAACEILPRFDAGEVWQRIVDGRITLLMAVPTLYARLVAAWEEAGPERQRKMSEAAAKLRLTVSGSAALPVPLFERWREITGHAMLERYGMTEIGMALSNPLEGERIPGTVGTPLPGVAIRLVDDAGATIDGEATPGELEVRGPAVFPGYWRRPEATRDAFRDGWFRTGDVAVREAGRYRLLGRRSVDVLKSGGEKISALEIENVLLAHPAIRECAVVGLPDPEWGQRVTAVVVPADARADLDLQSLRHWARQRLAAYKLPRELHLLDELPRNALGKVTKEELAAQLAGG